MDEEGREDKKESEEGGRRPVSQGSGSPID